MSTLDFYDLFTTFAELKSLGMAGCKIDTWPNLTAAYKLGYLNINSNKITSLPTTIGLTQSNTVFREIHMGGNSFSISLLPQFLSSLPNLQRLGLGLEPPYGPMLAILLGICGILTLKAIRYTQ